MGIRLEIIPRKDIIDQIDGESNIINYVDRTDPKELSGFKDMLILMMDQTIKLVPTCKCRKTTAPAHQFYVHPCPICNTIPSPLMDEPLSPLLYLAVPEDISGLVQYTFWNMMRNLFMRGTAANPDSMLAWVTDTGYTLTHPDSIRIAQDWERLGIQRGYNNFVDNLDEYLDIMTHHEAFKTRSTRRDVPALYAEHKEDIHVPYLSFMDSITRIMEKSGVNSYAGTGFTPAVDSIMGVAGIDAGFYSMERKQNILSRFMERYTGYYDDFLESVVRGKYGFYRGTVCGARGTRIMRTVISSIPWEHRHDHVYLPWTPTIWTLETVIISILLKKGLTRAQIRSFMQYCTNNYHPAMERILNKIIRDAKGLDTSTQRYPSMGRGSMLWMLADRIKTNPKDLTMSLSELAIRTLNADYDGDQLHTQIHLDRVMGEIIRVLRYSNNCLSNKNVSGLTNVEMTTPANTNLFRWLENADILDATDQQLKAMEKLIREH
jgi:hypothetical protein